MYLFGTVIDRKLFERIVIQHLEAIEVEQGEILLTLCRL